MIVAKINKLPECCDDCPFRFYNNDFEIHQCELSGKVELNDTKRPNNCPIKCMNIVGLGKCIKILDTDDDIINSCAECEYTTPTHNNGPFLFNKENEDDIDEFKSSNATCKFTGCLVNENINNRNEKCPIFNYINKEIETDG